MRILKPFSLLSIAAVLIAGGAFTTNANALTMEIGHSYCFSADTGEAVEEAVMKEGKLTCPTTGSTDIHEFTGNSSSGGTGGTTAGGRTGGGSEAVVDTIILNGCAKDDGKGGGITCILNVVVDILTVAVGVLGVLGIVIVGIQYLTAGGNEEQTRKAKRRMFEIVLGLVLYVLAYALLKWLVPGFSF